MADEELSAEDLREKLFHSFRNRGVLDSLKSQLRNRLVTELQQTAKVNLSNGKKKPPEESSLFYHAANSLVVDHLERCNFEYTLSIFLPESGTSKDKLLTVRDLLHLLRINKDSQLHKSLEGSLSSKIKSKSFLWEIMSQLLSQHGQTTQSSMAIQTEESASIRSPSIAEKLQFIDKAFSEQAEKENETWGSQAEQKIAEVQRKYEERKKAELEAEIKQYKASALASMRLEEKERCQREINIAKKQMERDYSMKAEMLRLKEKELGDLQHRQQKNQEEEAYSQRQNILQEMQAAKDRENEFKMRQELHLKTIQLEEERLKNEAEKIITRELALKDEVKRSQQKIEDEIQRYKFQHQESYQKRLHDLELREAQIKQNKESFERSKSTYMGYYDELEGKKEQLRQMQNQFEAAKYNIATLQQQKDTLLQKLDEVRDYSTVKDNEQMLRKEKDELQNRLEEQSNKDKVNEETIKELKEKLSKPSAELVSVRNEIKAIKDDAKNKEKLLKDKQRKLEARLQQESQRCVEYQRLYEEHLLRQKEMEHELDDLRAALHHTQTFLRMELERKRMSEASVSEIHDLTLPSPLVQPIPANTSIAFAPRTNQQDSETNSFMNDTANTQELIANTKDIFDKLEKKAKDFEESYRRFQSRMKNTGLDQFTSLPLVSLDRHTLQGYPNRQAEIIDTHPSLGKDTNIDKADEFVPLSWIPVTEKNAANIPESNVTGDQLGGSLDPLHFPSSLLPSTRQGNNTDSLTRFYSLPSFGVSEVTQNSSAPRYFGLSRTDRRPPNNTVNVSDLIAKPGSPSVISAPIDHSPKDNSTTDSGKGKKAKERHADSSTDTMRRPLSSTIDRVREGTGMGSRENDFLTSASSQRNSDHNSHVPVIDGSVFYGRKSDIDKDLSEQDSHRSSDASLSGGYLSMGTLSKPSRTRDIRKTANTVTDSAKEKENDEVDAYNAPVPTRISLDVAWGGAQDSGTVLKEKDEESSLSIHSNPSLPSIGEKVSVPLDSVWKDTEARKTIEEKEREESERKERELREKEEREWQEEKRKREEQRRQREQEAREREQRELEELQREQELRERKKHADHGRVQTEANTEKDMKEMQGKKEKESFKDPEIDPVMLQYMQMIQKKKEEEDKAKAVEPSKKESREAADTGSNSLLSQGDDNLGSIEELTDDDGFDWG